MADRLVAEVRDVPRSFLGDPYILEKQFVDSPAMALPKLPGVSQRERGQPATHHPTERRGDRSARILKLHRRAA